MTECEEAKRAALDQARAMIRARTDPQQRAMVYAAQEAAEEAYPHFDLDQVIPAQELEVFAEKVLRAAGWSTDVLPRFALDVPDDSELSGHLGVEDGMIHLHPRLLSPGTVLHEMAHWLDPRDGHGPRFCAILVHLVEGAFGNTAAQILLGTMDEFEVNVDRQWLDAQGH